MDVDPSDALSLLEENCDKLDDNGTLNRPPARVVYVVSNELAKISSLLPSNKNRSILVHTLVKQYGLLDGTKPQSARPVYPIPATVEELTRYHSRQYVDFVLDPRNFSVENDGMPSRAHEEFGIQEDCPSFLGLHKYIPLVAGATLTATNSLIKGEADIAICWDGGRHHAQKSKASGFCYVADCVLAILTFKRFRISILERPPRKARVMYLDLDLHFSDGVSQAFVSPGGPSGEPQVLTLSIHHASPGFFPISELSSLSDPTQEGFDPFTLSLPLARGASDATFSRIWKSVEKIQDAFQPDYVVVQCGVDGLAGDSYGVWNWSLGTSKGSLSWCVNRICHTWKVKTLLLGGGGYNHPNVARAWTHLTSVALGSPISLTSDIPDHSAFPLYAPSFTLDVPAGHAQDLNTEAHLADIENRFERVAKIISSSITTEELRTVISWMPG